MAIAIKNALPLPAGELVRIVAHAPLRIGQRNLVHGVEHQSVERPSSDSPGWCARTASAICAPDPHHRVQRGHRFLEDHGEIAAAPPPHLALGQRQQIGRDVLARIAWRGKQNPARDAGLSGKQPQHRQRRRRLARARLAHQPKRLAGVDLERDVVDSFAPAEADRQVLDPQNRRGADRRC